MTRNENMPWKQLILGMLSDGKDATLSNIYIEIEEEHFNLKKDGHHLINEELFKKDQRYGNRPKYQHTVRACFSGCLKLKLVERVDAGVYRITDKGKKQLKQYWK